jgi:NADH-quinone oxidoreductase subunit L
MILAVPSIAAGWLIGSIVHGEYFGAAIFVAQDHEWIAEMTKEFHGVWGMMLHALTSLPFWFAILGVATAYYLYILRPELSGIVRNNLSGLVAVLDRKYGFDEFNQKVFAEGAVKLGSGMSTYGDRILIDGLLVNGSARMVGWFANLMRSLQSGYIYHYAFSMIIGVFLILSWWLYRMNYPT